ncbi:MAG TPA: hypothetical protein VF192_14950 [Longimicrobiales bacterium]
MLYETDEFTIRAIADTIRLRADLGGSSSDVSEIYRRQDGALVERQESVREFRFRLVGQRIEITFPCPPNANCLPPPHLILKPSPGGLMVPAARPRFYARVEYEP